MTSFVILTLGTVLQLASGDVYGCAMAGCEPGGSRIVSLPVPNKAPKIAWTTRFSNSSSVDAAGCVSNFGAIRCAVPLERGMGNRTWNGLLGLSVDGSETFQYLGVSATHCDNDDSWSGAGSSLPLLGAFGDSTSFSIDGIALINVGGGEQWAEVLQPPRPCTSQPSSPSLSNSSLSAFVYAIGAEVFAYLPSGTPLAGIWLYGNMTVREDRSISERKVASGLFMSIASLQPSNGQRFLFLTRFYSCSPGPACDASVDYDAIIPSEELALVAVDLHHGAVGRMRTPWDGVGSPIKLPADLMKCAPQGPPSMQPARETIAVGGPLLADDAGTLIFSLSCGGNSSLHIFAYSVGGDVGAQLLWSAFLPESSLGAGRVSPALWLDAADPRTVWSAHGSRLASFDVSSGSLLSDAALVDIFNNSSCFDFQSAQVVYLAGPPVASQDADGSSLALLSVVAEFAGHSTAALSAVSTTNASSAVAVWCVRAPDGIMGAFTVATSAAMGTKPTVNETSIVFVSGVGSIVSLH